MCLVKSVGEKGVNQKEDVRIVQILLNLNIGSLIPLAFLKEDGGIGKATIGAIALFQTRVVGMATPTKLIEPGSETYQRLKAGLEPGLTQGKLLAIMPGATVSAVSRYFQPLIDNMEANGITTPLRTAHFLAQLGHESGSFRFSEEIASGAAYEGREDLGNTSPGDGVRFKGRGLIQITGRSNYAAYGAARGQDYLTEPRNTLLASDPRIAVDCSCWFWATRGLNALADSDNVDGITRRINGGVNGLADRVARLARAKCLLLP